MLRLEKNSHTREVSVTLRSKEPFFNRLFLHSLLIAVCLHIIPAIVFHVRPFKIKHTEVLPPVSMDIDVREPEGEDNALAFADKDSQGGREVLKPSLSLLTLPPPPALPQIGPMPLLASSQDPADSTIAAILDPPLQPPFLPLQVSGPLAKYALRTLLNPIIGPIVNSISYEVRCAPEVGKIFWYRYLEDSTEEAADLQQRLQAEKLLLLLEFESSPSEPFGVPGVITLYLEGKGEIYD